MSCQGHVLWTELNTHDVEKAKAFYGAAFGWTYQAMPMDHGMSYWVAKPEGADAPVVGMFQMVGPMFEGMPDHWLTYFGLDNIDASLAKLPELGGQILREAFDIPNVGRIAIVRGASGAAEGWMTPIARQA